MSNNVGALSKGAACESGKLIVQVVGKDHPTTQKLVIYDDTNMQQQEALTQQDKPEIQSGATFSSVLHVWDWEGQPKRNLWLEIASERGAPIRVPLLEGMRPTTRQMPGETQWNQIVPVVPMTPLPGSKSLYDLGTPVVVRNGYIYVFYQGRLWRELEVRSEDSQTTFHDVNLFNYRQGDGFKPGRRTPTGVALQEIWLPAQCNRRKVTDLQLCFSEVQLSPARLKRLEQDTSLRRERCSRPELIVSQATFIKRHANQPNGLEMLELFSKVSAMQASASQARTAHASLSGNAFPLAVVAPQRSRQPGFEWFLDHPGQFVCDLAGSYPATAKSSAQTYVNQCEQGNPPTTPDPLLELDAWADCLEHLVKSKRPAASNPDPAGSSTEEQAPDIWQAAPAGVDVLLSARNRQICGVMLDDHLYRMRYLKNRLESQQRLFSLCAQRATLYPNHGSALLIRQLVVPRMIGGKKNRLHESLSKVGARGRRDIEQFTAASERAQITLAHQTAQSIFYECLAAPRAQQTLADHLSLDGFDYLAELYFASQLLGCLAITADQLDPLAAAGTASQQESQGQKFISEMANNERHPLHLMLCPTYDEQSLLASYKAPAQTIGNQGDGLFRADELAAFENRSEPAGPYNTYNAESLAGLMASGSLRNALTAELKAGAGALNAICENLQGAVESAEAAVRAAEEARRKATQALADNHQQHTTSRQDQKRAERTARTAEQAEQRAIGRQQSAQAALDRDNQNLAQARQAEQNLRNQLVPQARPVNLRLHGINVERVRSMMRGTFGAAHFVRRSSAAIKDYYLFALEDIPHEQQRAVRMYGEFRDADNNLLASTNQRQAPRGQQVVGDHLVLGIPRNHRTAQIIAGLNQQIREVLIAERAAQAASSANTQAQAQVRQTGSASTTAREAETRAARQGQRAANDVSIASQNAQQAKGDLQSALDRLGTQQHNRFYQALNGKLFPASVLMLELWNINAELNGRANTALEKGTFRSVTGVISAGGDLVIAIEIINAKFVGNQSVLNMGQRNVFSYSRTQVEQLLGKTVGSKVITRITARLIAQTAAAVLMVGLCLFDSWHAWQWNDAAIWGYIIMTSGALVGAVGGFFATGATLFGLGPAGWAALLLLGIGVGLVYLFSSSPLEDWLGNGPFADSPQAPLNDSEEAFYRLLGLLTGITIRIESNPYYERNAKLDINETLPYKIRNAPSRIRVESNLPGLLGNLGEMTTRIECRLRTHTAYPHGVVSEQRALGASRPEAQVLWPNALELYLRAPDLGITTPEQNNTWHSWAVRAQLCLTQTTDQACTIRYFPAPSPRAKVEAGAAHADPDFDQVNQTFWADEETHKPDN